MIVVLNTSSMSARKISCVGALILPKRPPFRAGLAQQGTDKFPSGLVSVSATIIAAIAEVFNFTLKIHEYVNVSILELRNLVNGVIWAAQGIHLRI